MGGGVAGDADGEGAVGDSDGEGVAGDAMRDRVVDDVGGEGAAGVVTGDGDVGASMGGVLWVMHRVVALLATLTTGGAAALHWGGRWLCRFGGCRRCRRMWGLIGRL